VLVLVIVLVVVLVVVLVSRGPALHCPHIGTVAA
jgi:hypothetical protein